MLQFRRTVGVIFSAVFIVMFLASVSIAAYKYVDREGTPHLTDSIESIPSEYRDQVKNISDKTDGYAPSYEEVQISGENTELWFKYEEMNWMDKKRLVAQAGLNDLQGIFNDMLVQFAVITLLFGGCAVMVFVKIKKNSLRLMTLFMIATCFSMVLMAFYLKTTMSRGNSILQAVKGKGIQNTATGELATSQEGIMGQLQGLQTMSDDRQQMFQMIMNDMD
jgi:hypothetical protein